MREAIKDLKNCKKAIRDCCKTENAAGEAGNWVRDNARKLLLAADGAEKLLKKQRTTDADRIFRLCRSLCRKGETPDGKGLTAALLHEKPTSAQCDFLPCFLAASLACAAADGLGEADTPAAKEKVIRAVRALLTLEDIDFDAVREGASETEQLLNGDPSGVYPDMSEQTKKTYRSAVRKGAEKAGLPEAEYLRNILDLSREENAHIGFYLPVYPGKERQGTLFLAGEVLFSFLLSVLLSVLTDAPAFFFLLFPCVFAALKPASDALCRRLFPPFPLCSMDEEQAITEENETLIVVSALMPSNGKAEALREHLADLRGTDKNGKVRLLLLLDKKASPAPVMPEDAADEAAVKRLIDGLNAGHGGGFAAAVRERVYSRTENEYTGFERKRGALTALVRYLREGCTEGFTMICGDTEKLSGVRYIAALDSDTVLSFEVLRKLTAIASHPLNRPVTDPGSCRITDGYGCIVPRVETSAASAGKTFFSRLYTQGGSLAYAPAVSERYMDTFGQTLFTGKGLIDVEAYHTAVGSRLENGRILSHDVLEGALLRTAFAGSCEFTDSFPSKPSSFFNRMERWIRGDVQNLRYLFRPVAEKPVRTVLPGLTKYQLADNFRRAVTPAFALAGILVSAFSTGTAAAVLFAFSVLSECSGSLFACLELLLKGGISSLYRLYFSSEITTGLKMLLRLLPDAGLLPEKAAVGFSAAAKGFYRSLFSGKKLLQWTTAQQADDRRELHPVTAIAVPLVSAVLCLLSRSPHASLFALAVLGGIGFSLSDGIKLKSEKAAKPTAAESETLFSYAAEIWKFFEENVRAEDHYLPPDNVQDTPVRKTAHRTSPTNIGLYLVSLCAAYDLALIGAAELYGRMTKTLTVLESLPKFRGCLYNWYNTLTLLPLTPEYVSSVDCGNYLCCLTAVKESLKEYAARDVRFAALAEIAERTLKNTDMTFLYDRKRKLFRIGCDSHGGGSDAYYDLLMSEFRMTSYYETARRHVPAAHYGATGRQLLRSGRYAAAASWTGTAFEYFMPSLFLPTVPGTFLSESLKVALYTQKRRAAKAGIPYGISESCFYSVDASSDYRYKAHGVKQLAMKRSPDDEPVVSPYSTFLMLPFDLKSGMKNLARLSALNARGRYGFCEAVDFTRCRTDGEDYCIVRSFMSHHLGMSLVSAANVLTDGIFVRRFMRDPDMRSAKSLLEEKIPDEPDLFVRRQIKRKEKHPLRPVSVRPGAGESVFTQAAAYGNGEWTVFTDVYGRNRSVFASLEMYRCLPGRGGVTVSAKVNGNTLPLNAAAETKGSLTPTAYVFKTVTDGLTLTCALPVHPAEPALLVPVKLTNGTKENVSAAVTVFFEPSLLPFGQTDAHSAYTSLFLRPEYEKSRKALCFERLRFASGTPALCAGLYSGSSFRYEVERERILSRETDRDYPSFTASDAPEKPGGVVSPAAAITFTLTSSAGKSAESVLILTCGGTKEEALDRLERIRAASLPSLGKAAGMPFAGDAFTANAADTLIKSVFFGCTSDPARLSAINRLTAGRSALWQTGVSGDFPILTVNAAESCSESALRAFLHLHGRLKKAGITNDAVFLFRQTGDYSQTGEQTLRRLLGQEEMTDEEGCPGGLRLLNVNAFPESVLTALYAFSSYIYPESGEVPLPPPENGEIAKGLSPEDAPDGYCENGFAIASHPALPWSHTLSNKSFGTLLTDRSLGFTWAMDSALNKLTPNCGDTSSELHGERLFLHDGEHVYDCVGNAAVLFSDSFAEYTSLCGKLRVTVRVQVPEHGMKKTVSVKLTNTGEQNVPVRLIYRVRPLLHEHERYADFIRFRMTGDGVLLTNPVNEDIRGFMLIYGSSGTMYNISSESVEKYVQAGFAATLAPGEKRRTEFGFCFAKTPGAAEKLRELPMTSRAPVKLPAAVKKASLPPSALTLLVHQVYDTRILARTGFYQCSGAYGFRDQLQDALSLTKLRPDVCRQMIVLACSAQFPEGDVLHWFHPLRRNGKTELFGVRTRCSDDMLWLPYVTAKYIADTSDRSVLELKLPFLSGEALKEGEKECCRAFSRSAQRASVYEHCLRAFMPSEKTGAHGLPLIGGGDWNDSFGEMGSLGKGESVWLAMFRRAAALAFAPVSNQRGDTAARDRLLTAAREAASACDRNAWDGRKYLRAFYDDGTAAGAEGAKECETDILPQAWASLSDLPDRERRITALKTAYERLFDEEHGIVKLFSPPFTRSGKRAGYVNDYPAGMRENGGQYTHAAIWFLTALRKEGMDAEADRVLHALLPWEKYGTETGSKVYKTEPYALCGDVYAAEGLAGRGGWSLYTGSAGWLLQYFLS